MSIKFIVNGREHESLGITERFSYAKVVSLAGFPDGAQPTVAYRYRTVDGALAGRTMSPGEAVDWHAGIIFNVADTSHA